MIREDEAQAAALLGAARRHREPVLPLPEAIEPLDEADAYRIQTALRDWFTETGDGPAAGYKLGCTTSVMQEMLGVGSPVYGGVRQGDVYETGASFASGAFRAPGIECEIALRLGKDLDAGHEQGTRAEIAACVDAVMPAIEIVDNRYGDWAGLGTPTLIADDFFQAACVLGPAADRDPLSLDTLIGRTLIDGEPAGQGSGADVLGHPLDALAWLARALAKRGARLEAGQIVMTGSMVKTVWLDAFPVTAGVEIEGLGAVALTIEA